MSKNYSTNIAGILENINISKLKPFQYYYREDSNEEITNLAHTIQQYGLLHPIIVRNRDDFFEVITGIRRFKACKLLGWRKVLCHVIHLDDKEAFELSLMSNLQYKKLNPIEEASAFQQYLENYKWGDISQLACKIGKSHSYIHKRLQLLNLPTELKKAINESSLEPSKADELMLIKDKQLQSDLADLILKRKLTCKEIRLIGKSKENLGCNNNKDIHFNYKDYLNHYSDLNDLDKDAQRLFDKMIILLKKSVQDMFPIIEDSENNWIIYDIFMQHRRIINEQIDILIKEKKKLK